VNNPILTWSWVPLSSAASIDRHFL
jgi:hypothetical protein